MPAPLGSPVFYAATPTGAPAAGYKVFSYAAGTSTPLSTYPTSADASAGTNANANPVVLDANGQAQIWLSDALYKIVLETDLNVTVWTIDNVSGSSGSSSGSTSSEWAAFSGNPAFISATQFSVTGDQTATFTIGRRLKTTNNAGTIYSTVIASAFSSVTTITVVNDSGSLDSGLSSVATSILSPAHESLPVWSNLDIEQSTTSNLTTGVAAAMFSATAGTVTKNLDSLSEFANATFTAKLAGTYRVRYALTFEQVTSLTVAGGSPSIDVTINGSTDSTYSTLIASRLVSTQTLFPTAIMEFSKVLAANGTLAFTATFYFSGGSVRVNRAHLVIARIA